jgi:hypothetical protein
VRQRLSSRLGTSERVKAALASGSRRWSRGGVDLARAERHIRVARGQGTGASGEEQHRRRRRQLALCPSSAHRPRVPSSHLRSPRSSASTRSEHPREPQLPRHCAKGRGNCWRFSYFAAQNCPPFLLHIADARQESAANSLNSTTCPILKFKI